MAFCGNCGNKLEDGVKFCPNCGTPTDGNVPSSTKLSKKKSKKGVLIAAIVALIALVGGAVWYFFGNQQNDYSLEGLAKAAVNYDSVDDFHDGLAKVNKGEKIGFIDKMGNEVIPCVYDYLEDTDENFHDGLALVRQGDKILFINKEGKEAFPFKYDGANCFSEGFAVVFKDNKCGYIDTKGNEVIALTDKYYCYNFSDGMAAVQNNDGKVGFIDQKGNMVIPFNYDAEEVDGPSFSEGLAAVNKGYKFGYIDKSGKEITPFKYSVAFSFSEGFAVVSTDDSKYGYIDKTGKEVIPCSFSSAQSFSEGLAVVSKDGKYFYIDKTGNETLPCSYEDINSFQEGLARVSNSESKVGFIDKNGKEIVPCLYDTYYNFSEGLAVVEKDGLFGFVDKKGNSTFDIQDEEVKKIVLAKIQEKEDIQKQEEEEQRKAEEERKRIEEENSPKTKFYNNALNGYVWSLAYHKENNPAPYRFKEHEDVFFIYPDSPTSGNLSYIEYRWDESDPSNKTWRAAKAFYTINGDILTATLVSKNYPTFYHKDGNTISFRIIKDGEEVAMEEVDGLQSGTFTQKRTTLSDCVKKYGLQ